jgi:hypothetical protein
MGVSCFGRHMRASYRSEVKRWNLLRILSQWIDSYHYEAMKVSDGITEGKWFDISTDEEPTRPIFFF